jgi:hypothetical protein
MTTMPGGLQIKVAISDSFSKVELIIGVAGRRHFSTI